jgi:RNA polymerase sigma-70 factor (ECF subfamily)
MNVLTLTSIDALAQCPPGRARRTLTVADLLTDESLVLDYARTGNEAALAALVDRHWSPSYRLALRTLGDPGAAADAAQEAFVALIRAARTFEAGRDFAPWFRTIVMNAARGQDRSRRARARREEVVARKSPRETSRHEGEERLAAAEVAEQLGKLPFDLRSPVVLHYYEGCSHEEVADVLGWPRTTVTTRIQRGLEQLRESLAGAGSACSLVELEQWFRAARGATVPTPPAPSVSVLQAAAAKAKLATLGLSLAAPLAVLGIAASVWFGVGPGAAPPLAAAPATGAGAPANGGAGAGALTSTVDAALDRSAQPIGPDAPADGSDPAPPGAKGSPGRATVGGPGEARAAALLSVLVRDRAGQPLPGAQVLFEEPQQHLGDPARDRLFAVIRNFLPLGKENVSVSDAHGVATFGAPALKPGQEVFVYAGKGNDRGFAGTVKASPVARIEVTVRPANEPAPGFGAILLSVKAGTDSAAGRTLEVGWQLFEARGRTRAATEQEIPADAQGILALRDLDEGKHTIDVSLAGYVPGRVTVDLAKGAVESRELVLVQEAVIVGHVLAPPGVDLADVTVSAQQLAKKSGEAGNATLWFASLVADGYQVGKLLPGKYRVAAYSDGIFPSSVTVTIEGPGVTLAPDITLGQGARITGRVLEGGVAAPGARIELRRDDATVANAVAGDDGRFSVRGTPPGLYGVVVAERAGGARHEILVRENPTTTVEVAPGATEVDAGDIVLASAAPARTGLAGHVIGQDGKPAAGAVVTLTPNFERGESTDPATSGKSLVRSARADAQGHFQLDEVADGVHKLEDFVVQARAGELVSRPAPIDPAQAGDLTLKLEAKAGSLTGKITAPAEALAAGFVLSLYGDDGRSETRTAADGTYRFPDVFPGQVLLRVKGRFGRTQLQTQRHGLVVDAGGETRADFALATAVGRVQLTIEGAPEGVRASGLVTWEARGEIPDGSASLDRDAPGPLEGVACGPATAYAYCSLKGTRFRFKQPVMVTADTRVTFRWPSPAESGSVDGCVAKESLPASVVLESADLHVEVDTAADGSFHVDHLPAGHYAAHAEPSQFNPDQVLERHDVPVEVRAGDATRLAAPVPLGSGND